MSKENWKDVILKCSYFTICKLLVKKKKKFKYIKGYINDCNTISTSETVLILTGHVIY